MGISLTLAILRIFAKRCDHIFVSWEPMRKKMSDTH